MADKTIPALTTAALATGYFFPFAIDASTEAKNQTIDGLSRFIYQNYIATQPATYYTDSLGVNYGGFGVFGNLYVSGKFHANGTGYLDSISAGSIASNTIGDPTSHIIAGPSSVIQRSSYSVIAGGIGSLIKHGSNYTFVGGGVNHVVEGSSEYSSLIGGANNECSGTYGSLIGGVANSIDGGIYSFVAGGSLNNVREGDRSSIIGGYSNKISGDGGFIAGSYQSSCSGEFSSVISSIDSTNNGVYSTILGGERNWIDALSYDSSIFGGRDSIISGSLNTSLGTANARFPSSVSMATIIGDQSASIKRPKGSETLTLSFRSGVCVSGSSFEVERTGAFYGGVCAGTGRHTFTTLTGFFANPNSALAATSYSGILIPAPGVRYGDYVVVETNTYSGANFGAAGGSIMQFAPQAYNNEIRMFLFNPNGSSININSDMRWIAFKTNPLGLI